MRIQDYHRLSVELDNVMDTELRENLKTVLDEVAERGIRPGDRDLKGNIVLFTVDKDDYVGTDVISLEQWEALTPARMDVVAQAAASVDFENYRDRIDSDLGEVLVDAIMQDETDPTGWQSFALSPKFLYWMGINYPDQDSPDTVLDDADFGGIDENGLPPNPIGEMFVVTTDKYANTVPMGFPRGTYVQAYSWDKDTLKLTVRRIGNVWGIELEVGEFVWSPDAEVNGGSDE